MTNQRPCAHCGKSFKNKDRSVKFCSRPCYWASMRGVEKLSRRKRIKKNCITCGKEFEVRECHSYVQACSLSCRKSSKPAKKRVAKRYSKTCPNCKKSFETPRDSAKFCNNDCYQEFRSKHVKYPYAQRLQTANWKKAREIVIARDKNCRMCHGPAKEVHHRVPYAQTADDHPDNLILLCKSCHVEVHALINRARQKGYEVRYNDGDSQHLIWLEKVSDAA